MRLLNTIIHPNLRRFRLTMSGYFSETYHLLTSASISFEYEPSEESNLLAPEPKVHKVLELRTGISCEQGASEHRAHHEAFPLLTTKTFLYRFHPMNGRASWLSSKGTTSEMAILRAFT